jgi:hypothetical protein
MMSPRNLPTLAALLLSSLLCLGQEVTISRGIGTVALSVTAQKSYALMSGEEKSPTLTVECAHKGKKTGHVLSFTAGSALAEGTDMDAKGAQLILNMTVGGTKQKTGWVPYGDTITYAYFAKSDVDRVKFIQSMLDSGRVSIEFKPFLTGKPTTSVFDVSKVREEMDKSPECAATPTK